MIPSPDGVQLFFPSFFNNLVPNDLNGTLDHFEYDLTTQRYRLLDAFEDHVFVLQLRD